MSLERSTETGLLSPGVMWKDFPDSKTVFKIAETLLEVHETVQDWIQARPTMQTKIDISGRQSERIYVDWVVRDRNYSIQALLEAHEFYESALKHNHEGAISEIGDVLFYLLLTNQYITEFDAYSDPQDIVVELKKNKYEELVEKLNLKHLHGEVAILTSVAAYGRETIGINSESVFGDIEIFEKSDDPDDEDAVEIVDFKFQHFCLCLYTIYNYLDLMGKDPLDVTTKTVEKNNRNFPREMFDYQSPYIFDSDGIECCRLFRKALPGGMEDYKKHVEIYSLTIPNENVKIPWQETAKRDTYGFRWSVRKLLADIFENEKLRPLYRQSAEGLLNRGVWDNESLHLKD